MPSYSATAFKWTGTHYNAKYDESHDVTFTDNDDTFEGGRDGDERVSIDGGAEQPTSSHAYCIKCNFTDTEGDQHVEDFNFFNAGNSWYFVPKEGSQFTEGCTLGSYKSHTVGWEYDSVACFADGTLIATPSGPARVEDLAPGERVSVPGGLSRPLRLVLTRGLRAVDLARAQHLRPVCIAAGALGGGLPTRDLFVSRQHRLLVRSVIAARMFGASEVLVSAAKLVGLPGIAPAATGRGVVYHQLLFDRHEVILANGTPAESFLPGPEARRTLPKPLADEFNALFPGFATASGMMPSARPIPSLHRQKRLVSRHRKHAKPVLEGVSDLAPVSFR